MLSCKIFTSFWATWDGLGRITFGTGGVFGEHVLLDYHGNAGFRLNMMSLASIKRTAEWRFYKGNLKGFFYSCLLLLLLLLLLL